MAKPSNTQQPSLEQLWFEAQEAGLPDPGFEGDEDNNEGEEDDDDDEL